MAKDKKTDITPVPKADLHDSRWINTPFSYTRLGANFSLLQQEIMLKVSDALQAHVKKFYDDKRYKTKDRPNPLFITEPIPPVRIQMSELTIDDNHYSRLDQIRKEIIGLDIMVDAVDEKGQAVKKWMPVFDEIAIPFVEKGYNKRIGTTGQTVPFDKKRGYMDFSINPKVAQHAFDMAEGYVNHMKQIAAYSRKQSTPRIYLMLRKAMSKELDKQKSQAKGEAKVLMTVKDVKEYTGVIEHLHLLDKDGNAYEETRDKYPKFSRFCKEVLDNAREDLLRMAPLNQTDIIFDYVPVYNGTRRRGDPDFIEFKVMLSNLGKNRDVLLHRVAVENDLLRKLTKRCPDFDYSELKSLIQGVESSELVAFQQYALKDVWRIVEQKQPDDVAAYAMTLLRSWQTRQEHKEQTVVQRPMQQELFTEAEVAEPVNVDTLMPGEGRELWKRLLAEYDGPAKAALREVKYLGLDAGVFCIRATDEQREEINTKGNGDLYRVARLILGMSETSFRPPIVIRKA